MCLQKTIVISHFTFSIITAVGLYLALPVILAWDSSKLQISTLQMVYIYIGYCIYWIVTSLISLVGLLEKRKQLLDLHSKICPLMIFVGICGFVAYMYQISFEKMDISNLNGMFKILVLPNLMIIGIGLDIWTSINVSKVRKKMWIEPYSDQLREHIYESNQNLTAEEDCNKETFSERRKSSHSITKSVKTNEQYVQ